MEPHCYKCKINFSRYRDLINHVKTHVKANVKSPSVILIKLSKDNDKNTHLRYQEKFQSILKLGKLRLTLNLLGQQASEVPKPIKKMPKHKGIRILTAEEVNSSASNISQVPLKPADEIAPKNPYFSQFKTEEVSGEATGGILRKLLQEGHQNPQETPETQGSSLNTSEFKPIEKIAYIGPVSNSNFSYAVQPYGHKKDTGCNIEHRMQPSGSKGFSSVGSNFRQQSPIIRTLPPLYRKPSLRGTPSPMNRNKFIEMTPNRQIPMVQIHSLLGITPERGNRPRPAILRRRRPPPTVASSRFLKNLFKAPSGPSPKETKIEINHDCEMVSPNPQSNGLRDNEKGQINQPQKDGSKDSNQLNKPIMLSAENQGKNANIEEIASTLARRGVSLILKVKTTPGSGGVQEVQANNSINNIPKKNPETIEKPSPISKQELRDSLIFCPFDDCEENFLTVAGFKKHRERVHWREEVSLNSVLCNECPSLFTTLEALADHQRKDHQLIGAPDVEVDIPTIDLTNDEIDQNPASVEVVLIPDSENSSDCDMDVISILTSSPLNEFFESD